MSRGRHHAVTSDPRNTRGHTAIGVTAHGEIADGVSDPRLVWALGAVIPNTPEEVATVRQQIADANVSPATRRTLLAMIFGEAA